MKTLVLTPLMAILSCSTALSQVTVEFGTSGELIVHGTMPPERDTDSETLLLSTPPATEHFVASPPFEEVAYAIAVPSEEAFGGTTASEKTFPIPAGIATSVSDLAPPLETEKLLGPELAAREIPDVDVHSSPSELDRSMVESPKLEELLRTQSVSFRNITFEFGSAVLRPEAHEQLEGIASALKRDTSLRIEVVGHTDNVGSADANIALSQQRAAAVASALVESYAISADRLTWSGRGEHEPIATNITELGRQQNRRVELVAW